MIQTRYGWTDDEVMRLPVSRFFILRDRLIADRNQASRDEITLVAVGAYLTAALMGAPVPDMNAYLRSLKLTEQ